ncbi:hypothetical protein cypCar_00033852 [Cyprinus carpio]|nr:hypothetical protein cypCar_00033852 [Cyprinus carpio]
MIMVSSGCALMVLMVTQVFFGGSSGLVPQIGRSFLSQDVLHAFELRLLSMFGLKHRPSPSRSAVVPQYMMDLYSMHSVNAEQSNSNRPKGSLGKASERSASRANTIRSFHHDESVEDLYSLSGKTTQRFLFNLTSIPGEEFVTSAELRIFREQVVSNGSEEFHRINIHEIIKPSGSFQEPITRLLDTRLVQHSLSKWESFDVSPAVTRWTADGHPNHGFVVEIVHPERAEEDSKRHVRISRSLHEREDTWPQMRPLLVTYSHDGKGNVLHSREKRQSVLRNICIAAFCVQQDLI